MYSSVSLHQVVMESPFLRLNNMQWKIIKVVGEVVLAEILSNC